MVRAMLAHIKNPTRRAYPTRRNVEHRRPLEGFLPLLLTGSLRGESALRWWLLGPRHSRGPVLKTAGGTVAQAIWRPAPGGAPRALRVPLGRPSLAPQLQRLVGVAKPW